MKRILFLSGTVWLPVVLFSGMFRLLEVRSQSADTFDQTSANFATSPVQSNLGINIVTNGSFEEPDVEAITFDTYYAGQSFGHWTVESGSIDHISEHYWQAAGGRQSVDLSGDPNSPGTISQMLLTTPLQAYLLQFALAGNPETSPCPNPEPIKTVEIWWDTTLVDTLNVDVTDRSNWDMGWGFHQYTITATNSLSELRFKSLTLSCYGPVIDSVSVQSYDETIPLMDLPFHYAGLKFSEVAQGNDGSNPGRVNSWFDHSYPTYDSAPNIGTNNLRRWDGTLFDFTEVEPGRGVSWYDGHDGIDFSGSSGTPVLAAASGNVTFAGQISGYCSLTDRVETANVIKIQHDNGYMTEYWHLLSFAPGLSPGTEVSRDPAHPIAYSGNTGCSSGPHLHFLVRNPSGMVVDPYGWFGEQADPWSELSVYMWMYPLWERKAIPPWGNLLTTPSGTGKVTIPDGALVFTTTLELWDLPFPNLPASTWRGVGNAIWLRVVDEGLRSVHTQFLETTPFFEEPVTVNVRYETDAVKHLDANQLNLYYLDEETDIWTGMTTTVDANIQEAFAETTAVGYFSLQAPLVCPEDTGEVDDDINTEHFIPTDGNPIRRLFDIADDEDWFRFTAIAGGDYTISLSAVGSGVDTIIQLYETDGITILAEIDDPGSGGGSLEWSAPGSGTYFIRVLPSTGGAVGCDSTYDLSVSQIVPTCNACYNFNESPDGEIDVQDILFVANRWGETSSDPTYDSKYDVFCSSSSPPDGNINVLDIQTVANRWGQQSCQPSVFSPGEFGGGLKQFELTSLPTATVSVYPQGNLVDIDDSVNLEILIENAQNLGGFEFRVSYNPSVVQVFSADSITLGDFLGSTGRTATLLPAVIDNNLGSLRVGAFSFGSSGGPSGAGKLVNIKFDSVGAGLSGINLNDVLLSTADTTPQIHPSIGVGGSITVSSPFYLPIVIK